MPTWFLFALPCLVLLAFGYALRRANELFALSARRGKLVLLRGRLPQALFADLAEIAGRAQLDDTEIRALSESGAPRLVLRGAPNLAAEQASRNLLGRYTVPQIRSGRLRAGR
jgi:hypothetical protein